MTTEIKICGLSTEPALQTAIGEGAALIGLIFFEKSPRNVSIADAARLAEAARGKAKIVAVTVNADDAFLDEMIPSVQPDILQLHGNESPERVAELKVRIGLPVIKALAIREAPDLERINPYLGVADRFLLDAKAPEGSDLPGGNGVSFDWNLLGALDREVDYMLSGGLDVANVTEALVVSGATAIDVSSGVEAAPGVKDIAKITAFIKTVRDHDRHAASSAA